MATTKLETTGKVARSMRNWTASLVVEPLWHHLFCWKAARVRRPWTLKVVKYPFYWTVCMYVCMYVAFDEMNEVEGKTTERAASPSSTSSSTVGLTSTTDSLSQVSVSSSSSHSDTQQPLESNNSAPDKTQSDSKEGICLWCICVQVIIQVV